MEIPSSGGFKIKTGCTFEECKRVILLEAEHGQKLKQIVTPFNKKTGIFTSKCYQIVFERELSIIIYRLYEVVILWLRDYNDTKEF